jgi:16S rRNA (cytosine1402-N4)-methyltransferase
MQQAVLQHLINDRNGDYIDATFGRGGHTLAVLQQLGPQGRVLAFDRDPAAITAATELQRPHPALSVVHAPFSEMKQHAAAWAPQGVHGIFMDLGVSSPQLDQPARGFSYHLAGPLDMRMDPNSGQSAADWLAHADAAAIADVLYYYGEERKARQIAQAIVHQRAQRPLQTTLDLANLVVRVVGRQPGKKHPARRTFQAIRMHVNRELDELESALKQGVTLLRPGGCLAVISFHSIEDRLVKRFMKAQSQVAHQGLSRPQKVFPDSAELEQNRRARSAVLRWASKREQSS